MKTKKNICLMLRRHSIFSYIVRRIQGITGMNPKVSLKDQKTMVHLRKFSKILFTLLLVCITVFVQGQSFPAIHMNRPRIWADSARFSWLQNNVTTGDCGATYVDFKYRYDNYWITDPQLYLAGSYWIEAQNPIQRQVIKILITH